MLRAVNWSEKLGQIFGGHRGRVLRILILFLFALGILIGVYKARSVRLEKEKLRRDKPLLKIHAASLLPAASTSKWIIVGNPDEDKTNLFDNGRNYVCSVAKVAKKQGWKSVILGSKSKLDCCIMPDCYPINSTQLLRMNYRTAVVLRNLTEVGNHPQSYKDALRNVAFLWVIHRGARWVFDAYVEEYQSANVTISRFEEEFTRQLQTLALDESLALVQERGRSRGGLFRNPYSHFGRPDVRLVPNIQGTVVPGAPLGSAGYHHTPYHQYMSHGNSIPNKIVNLNKYQDYPTFRICEVRPPHIEKFLEVDGGWWDMQAPALVLPGDTMPPLCTRNTLFSPEVFWALPLLPDYSRDDFKTHSLETQEDTNDNKTQPSSRIPPWYIRGLWSQSLLGDLGGSIRLSLSRVPTLQMNQDYFAGGDYDQNPSPSNDNSNSESLSAVKRSVVPLNRTGSAKLLKRWHCRSRSTFRCLLLMSRELSKSIYLKKNDLALIEAWIVDLKTIHYMEPPMLPRRRSHTNPCLGADGLHGVSFYPSLEPNDDLLSEEYISKRNETLMEVMAKINSKEDVKSKTKREAELPGSPLSNSDDKEEIVRLVPPSENASFAPLSPYDSGSVSNPNYKEESSYALRPEDSRTLGPYETYYSRYKNDNPHGRHLEQASRSRVDYFHPDILPDQTPFQRHDFPPPSKSSYLPDRMGFLSDSRSAKHLHDALSKHHEASIDGFPILKAMTETMCSGFGDLVPYQPATVHSDVLLIVAFTNHHYDLIPTLEVLYRSSFPNILYCGNPHESVELFLRKYQSVEHRSFSFLPTYTRATYECVLGAMEMNYEVKGYMVITDETLIKTWNINHLNKSKIWVSSSSDHENRHVPVTKETWPKLDPRGQKLPRLLDGLANTWKMLTYFLIGHDSYLMEPATVKRKRSTDNLPESPSIEDLIRNNDTIVESTNTTNVNAEATSEPVNRSGDQWDLATSWGGEESDSAKRSNMDKISLVNNSTEVEDEEDKEEDGGMDETADDVEVGEEDDENDSSSNSDGSEITWEEKKPVDETSDTLLLNQTEIITDQTKLDNTTDLGETFNSTMDNSEINAELENFEGISSSGEQTSSTTPEVAESSVGVPLYHVEHIEPPTPPTYHKPDDKPEKEGVNSTHSVSTIGGDNVSSSKEVIGDAEVPSTQNQQETPSTAADQETKSAQITTNPVAAENVTSTEKSPEPKVPISSPTPELSSVSPGSDELLHHENDHELKREMEVLLDGVKKVYLNLVGLVQEYQEANHTETGHHHDQGLDDKRGSVAEDAKSHRISPREFRHIRCTLQDDGHQSELCFTLRAYVNTLLQNIGTDIHLYHDTIPMYYLPSSTTKPFYSIANVLLHHGVMDELALPLLFRGLAPEPDWIKLHRSPNPGSVDLQTSGGHSSALYSSSAGSIGSSPSYRSIHTVTSSSNSTSDNDLSPEKSQYLHPFHLHKVYSDQNVKEAFCKDYLLRIFQM